MKTKGIFAVLLVWLTLTGPSLHAVDHKWHVLATLKAMQENGFSEDARLLAQFTNFLVDFYAVVDEFAPKIEAVVREQFYKNLGESGKLRIAPDDVARLHFDNLSGNDQFVVQWRLLERNTVNALKKYATLGSVKPGFRPIVLLTITGISLHVLQDFYTHSNWVDECFKTSRWVNAKVNPTWFELPPEELPRLNLVSGVYPEGNEPGIVYHKQVNKDNSDRPGHAQAVEVMNRASVEWVRRLISACPEVDWDALRSYKVKTVPEKRWLRQTDANLITSIASIASHWDGPGRYVFDSSKVKDTVKACRVLNTSLADYSVSLLLVDNPYKLPTPNWVGYYVYHVEAEISAGLLPLRDFSK
jgi:hypothetical protein